MSPGAGLRTFAFDHVFEQVVVGRSWEQLWGTFDKRGAPRRLASHRRHRCRALKQRGAHVPRTSPRRPCCLRPRRQAASQATVFEATGLACAWDFLNG